MGFELGGEAGARLGKKLSYPGSPNTILRLVKGAELPAVSAPRVIGLDDWSWKRGLRYGTLICDLESNKPIDVLPARTHREEEARLARRAQKRDRYEQVLEMHEQGLSAEDIGPRIGISGRTVRRWLAHGSFPEA